MMTLKLILPYRKKLREPQNIHGLNLTNKFVCFSVYYSVTFAEYSLVGWSYPTCILLAGETCPLFGQRKYGRPNLM